MQAMRKHLLGRKGFVPKAWRQELEEFARTTKDTALSSLALCAVDILDTYDGASNWGRCAVCMGGDELSERLSGAAIVACASLLTDCLYKHTRTPANIPPFHYM